MQQPEISIHPLIGRLLSMYEPDTDSVIVNAIVYGK